MPNPPPDDTARLRQGSLALIAATATWGSLFHVGKALLPVLDPYWFTVGRYVLAAIAMLPIVWMNRRAVAQVWRTSALPLTLRGVIGYGIFSVLLFEGLKHTVPAHGAVVVSTMPVTTMLLRWLIDGQRPTAGALLIALMALFGVACVSGALFGAEDGASTLHGDALILLGTVGWVIYTRGAARFPTLGPLPYTAVTALAAAPLLVLMAAVATGLGHAAPPSAEGWREVAWPLIYVAAVPTVFGVIAFNVGVQRLGAVSGTMFMSCVPVSAMLIGIARGQTPALHEWLGMAIVIAALLLYGRLMQAMARRSTPAQSGSIATHRADATGTGNPKACKG